MISNFSKMPSFDKLKKIISLLPLIFIVSCASTVQFHNPSINVTKSDEQLATLQFKRKSVSHGGGRSLYVIDYDIKDNPNGVMIRMSPSSSTFPCALLWAPDGQNSLKGYGILTYPIKKYIVAHRSMEKGTVTIEKDPKISGPFMIRITNSEGKTVSTDYRLPIEKGVPIEVLLYDVLDLHKDFDEIGFPIKGFQSRVIFKQVTIIGKTANKGTLSWKRPAGRFKLGLVLDNGDYFESPYIEVLPGEVKYVGFQLYGAFEYPFDSKFYISNTPFSD